MTGGMQTAELMAEDIVGYRPVTNLYLCSDDQCLLVMVPSPPTDIAGSFGFGSFTLSEDPEPVAVFLADVDGVVLDADGDPSNGMTPLELFYDVATHAQALARVGYTLVEDTP